LLIVDVVVAAEVEESVVEVGEGLLKVAHEEIGHALLEVCNGEVLVQPHSALVAVHLFCISNSSRKLNGANIPPSRALRELHG
jgi:hypothetical protein